MTWSDLLGDIYIFKPLETKDLVTILLSSTSLMVSLFLILDKRRKDQEEAKSAFVDSLSKLLETRMEVENQEYLLAENEKPTPKLRHLIDKRDMLISRLVYIVNRFNLIVSSHEFIALAASLIDHGRIGESIPFYKRGILAATNNYEKANAQRVYGRALIAAGSRRTGREHMLEAADLFMSLQDDPSFEHNRVLLQAAETYRRLIAISLRSSFVDFISDDFKTIETILQRVQVGFGKQRLEADLKPLREQCASNGLLVSNIVAARPENSIETTY